MFSAQGQSQNQIRGVCPGALVLTVDIKIGGDVKIKKCEMIKARSELEKKDNSFEYINIYRKGQYSY